jgi:nicotinamidase-related amidase
MATPAKVRRNKSHDISKIIFKIINVTLRPTARTRRKMKLLFLAILILTQNALAQDIVEKWSSIGPPPAPELKPVSVDNASTALLVLDFNKQTCSAERRPRCIATIPRVEALLKAARAKNVLVIYSLSVGATLADLPKELVANKDDLSVISGPDKFLNTNLEKILKDKKIKTVITVGTAANGAVLYTASGAIFRGLKAIIPIDGIAGDNELAEQFTVWQMKNAPRMPDNVTLTKLNMVKF